METKIIYNGKCAICGCELKGDNLFICDDCKLKNQQNEQTIETEIET